MLLLAARTRRDQGEQGRKRLPGAGYLDPTLKDAGVTAVDCTDPTKMVVTTDDPSDRVLQVAMPIIPKHVWGKETYKTIAREAKFDPPLVGTGPYTAVEWQTGQFIQLVRNPNYWGTKTYPDEVVIAGLQGRAGHDGPGAQGRRARLRPRPSSGPAQPAEDGPDIATVAGSANGWTQLAFNTYGTETGKTITSGGPSTKALLDPAFRDALGYAIDKDAARHASSAATAIPARRSSRRC